MLHIDSLTFSKVNNLEEKKNCTWNRDEEGGFGVIPLRNLSRFDRTFVDDDHHHILVLNFSFKAKIRGWRRKENGLSTETA